MYTRWKQNCNATVPQRIITWFAFAEHVMLSGAFSFCLLIPYANICTCQRRNFNGTVALGITTWSEWQSIWWSQGNFSLSFHRLGAHMHEQRMKYQRNCPLECHHEFCIWKPKRKSLRGVLLKYYARLVLIVLKITAMIVTHLHFQFN